MAINLTLLFSKLPPTSVYTQYYVYLRLITILYPQFKASSKDHANIILFQT